MIIEPVKEKGKSRYNIIEIDRGKNVGLIANYDSLEQAAMVMRYLKGAYMPNGDQKAALRLIFQWDVRQHMKESAEK